MKTSLRWLTFVAAIISVLFLSTCRSEPQATPTESLSVGVTPANSPQILHQSPIQGQRLDLLPTIQLTFDRAMDQSKTGAAWSFQDEAGLPVFGTLTWLDDHTLQFKPGKTLDPGKAYTAVLSTAAAGADGTKLAQEIRIDFKTTDALVVGQVFPADATEDVDYKSAITVIFNKPVVPLMSIEDQLNLPSPIEITPPVAGTGEWVSSSVYVYQPDKGLSSGTSYQVRVRSSLRDTTGSSLDQDYVWGFKTSSPSVAKFVLTGEGNVYSRDIDSILLNQGFMLIFNQPMDEKSVAAALKFSNRETGAAFPVRLSWDAGDTQLSIVPAGRYTIASFYDLTLDASASAQDGGTLQERYQVKLATFPLPRVDSVSPESGKQTNFTGAMTINFVSPMNLDSLKSRVAISPQPKQPVSYYYDDTHYQLNVYGLDPSTSYVVRLLPGMADIYGNTIKSEYSFSFETAGLDPSANLLVPYYPLIYRAKGEKSVFFEYTNLTSAKVSLYSLTYDEFSAMLQDQSLLTNVDNSSKKALGEWTPNLVAQKDNLGRIRLDLEASGPLGPGYYFVGMTANPITQSGRYLQGAIFIVAPDSLTLKASQTEALAWLVDQETGQPVPNVPVIFYNQFMTEVGRGTTDANGLAYVQNAPDVSFARSDDPAHLAMAALQWGSGVSEGQFGIWSDYYTPAEAYTAYVYTDRALYRPGQTVFYKGIVRTNDDLHYSLPDVAKVNITIENDQGKLFQGDVSLSKDGSFSGDFQVGDDAQVGNYDISVRRSAEETIISSVPFRVAAYTKPEFQVTTGVTPGTAVAGDPVQFSLQASYYSGGNVANAQVDWFMESNPYYYSPPDKYSSYSFSDFDYSSYYAYDNGPSNNTVIQNGSGSTDVDGHFGLAQTASLNNGNTDQQTVFSVNVTDVGGNLVGDHASLIVYGSALHPGIRTEDYVGTQGKPQTFHIAVLDMNDQPVANQAVSVQIVNQLWFSVVKQDENGVSKWETSVKNIPVSTLSVKTDADGLAQVSFTPSVGGEYKAIVTSTDGRGRKSKASSYLWISSQTYIAWQQTNDRSFQLIADKKSYDPGDTARIMIAQPFQGEVYALITLERGHIYQKKVVKLDSNSTVYELPITADMAPVMYVTVTVVKGADGKHPSDFKIGMTTLTINPSQQSIDVGIFSDKSTAKPGDDVTYTIVTKDLSGRPVQADVSLALIDKAVLALAPSNSLTPMAAFYPMKALGVVTANSIVLNAEDFNANYQETSPSGERGGGGGGKGEDNLGIISIRENFKDTAFWDAQVTTGPDGIARVKVTLPDNLTTWQMDARAVTDDTRVGEATQEILATRPLSIQLQTPRFFVIDDQAQIGVVVHNNTKDDLAVKVALTTAEGVSLQSEAAQTVEVPALQQSYVTWQLTVKADATRVDLVAQADGGGYTDSTRPTLGTLPGGGIPILAYHVTEAVGSSGALMQADSVTQSVLLPQSVDFSNPSLTVSASPSIAASMTDGLTYLEDYPYLCMEQTVSRFLPNLLSIRALTVAGKSTSDLQKSLDENVRPALQRINSNQNYDGGWGLWPGSQSQPTTSAYVIIGLVEARKSGYTVSDSVLTNGLNYLSANLPAVSSGNQNWQNNQVAFMLFALAEGGQPNDGVANGLYVNRSGLDIYGKAFLMQAMYISNPQDGRIPTLLSEIDSAAATSAGSAWWNEKDTDYWNWNTDVRTTAIVLNALIQVDPKNALIPNGIRWLMKSSRSGHWYSTQETAWSLMALTNWLTLSGEYQTNFSYAIGLNGDLVQSGQADAAHLTDTTTLNIAADKLLSDAANYLVLTRGNGPGTLYYDAYLSYSLPVADVTPLDQGIIVSRQYFRPDDPKTPITEAQRNDLVQVRLTIVVPDSLHYVVIDDPLPAGLEAIDASLQTSQEVPTSYTIQDYGRYGWGWWYFYYKQIYDTKVVMSADYLPAGTYVITYLARASSAGQFNVLPVTASEFYFPDVAGRSAGSIFVVKP
ncbi:MAG TPA: Ig-like domain-containing protein [Anaerolineales bacterium]|nr:Ig-like domain-containing protein [Anaerolineales bacterium]